MYGVQITSKFGKNRNQLANLLKKNGIDTRTFFCPLNLQPFLKKIKGYSKHKCPVSESLWEQGIYLPSSNNLKEKDIKRVCTLIKEYSKK